MAPSTVRRRPSTVFDEEEQIESQLIKLKEAALRNFLPLDQILYKESHAAKLPPGHHKLGVEGDVIGLNTRFDLQASIGKFGLDETDGDTLLSQFGVAINKCITLRDKYIDLSFQDSVKNPMNSPEWVSYPRAQPKGWHYKDEHGASDYYFDHTVVPHYSGESFDLEEYIKTDFQNAGTEDLDANLRWSGFNAYLVGANHKELPKFKEFFHDLKHIINTSIDRDSSMVSARRLQYLSAKFESYTLLNEQKEIYLTKLNPHRDFYNVRKVDNNCELSMSMTKRHLLGIINEKLRTEPDRIVYKGLTLEEIFLPYLQDHEGHPRLNIDDLFELGIVDRNVTGDVIVLDASTNVYPDESIQTEALLRIDKTFLRMDNDLNGEYLSEILRQVLSDLEKSKYCLTEVSLTFNLLSDYYEESNPLNRWETIADWIIDQKLISHNIKWIIRIPRDYSSLKKVGRVRDFKDFLDKIFKELFEVSINPQLNPKLHFFLTKVSAFDLLSSGSFDENKSIFDFKELKPPSGWNSEENPPYCYYLYYIFINLASLNRYRASRGFCTFSLRPHAPTIADKSGNGLITESLAANFLLSKSIINGEKLVNYPVLEYLYYLKQIGITMSPLCWNKSIETLNSEDEVSVMRIYEENPIINFFQTGLMVSLSTNKPLFASLTRDPLIEEYSIAASIHKLSGVDLCELSRNSVLISGFNGFLKRHWIGIKYVKNNILDHVDTDDFAIQRSNVPNMRLNYRKDALLLEHEFIRELNE